MSDYNQEVIDELKYIMNDREIKKRSPAEEDNFAEELYYRMLQR